MVSKHGQERFENKDTIAEGKDNQKDFDLSLKDFQDLSNRSQVADLGQVGYVNQVFGGPPNVFQLASFNASNIQQAALNDKEAAAMFALAAMGSGLSDAVFGQPSSTQGDASSTGAGQSEASRVYGKTVVDEADIASAEAAYGNISGISLEAVAARGALQSAIEHARGKLDAAHCAQTNGSGDNPDTIQANFGSEAEYRQWKERQLET